VIDTIERVSQLESNLKQWTIYRHILYKLLSPQRTEDLQNTEIGAISELNEILWDLEKWGGLTFSNDFWCITEAGKKALEKYGSSDLDYELWNDE
jgi:hypothetical protein